MSLLASDLVPTDAPFDRHSWSDVGPAGTVRTMEAATAGRWFAVDVLVIPATRPADPAERLITAASRAAGPIALALAILIPVAALFR